MLGTRLAPGKTPQSLRRVDLCELRAGVRLQLALRGDRRLVGDGEAVEEPHSSQRGPPVDLEHRRPRRNPCVEVQRELRQQHAQPLWLPRPPKRWIG